MTHAKPRYTLVIDQQMAPGLAKSLASEVERGKEVYVWPRHKLDVLRHVDLKKVSVRLSHDESRSMTRIKGETR